MSVTTTGIAGLAASTLVVATIVACDVRVGDEGISLAVADGRASDEWVRSYALTPGGRLEIANENGSIRAEPSDSTQVSVRVTRRVTRAGNDDAAREILAALDMGEQVAGDRVRLEARSQVQSDRFGRGPRLRLDYEVRVPSGVQVELRTGNGNIDLDRLDGGVTASVANGRIRGQELGGAVEASTTNGAIEMDLASVSADSRFTVVNGGVRLFLPADARAEFEGRAVNGGVSVDDALGLGAGTREPNRVVGSLNGGGPRLVAEATNGGVRVRLRGRGGAPD